MAFNSTRIIIRYAVGKQVKTTSSYLVCLATYASIVTAITKAHQKICNGRTDWTIYRRPVMAFGYCHRLSLSVCMCVCVSVNHQFVREITCHSIKLQSPKLDKKCKTPWLRSLLCRGFIDLDLQGQIEIKSQNLPHFRLATLSGR